MEIADIRRELGLENLDPEDIDRIKLQLQQINDTIQGGLRSANLAEYRNTYVINAQDSLDATYPMYVHFNIISEMVKIVSIKLSFWLLPFRSYSKAGAAQCTPSGGGDTSGDGGGQTSSSVSTPSGGGSTSGASGSASGGGATSGSKTTPSGGGATSGSGGGQTSSTDSGGGWLVWTPGSLQSVTNVGDENRSGYLAAEDEGDLVSAYGHTHTVANHQHTTPDHTHPSHTHTTPNHTHPNHTHSTPDHTHPEHSHTVSNHTHSTPDHTHPNHTHSAVYGIFEEETSPTIQVFISRDNGLTYSLPLGSFTKDQQLDITRFIDTAGSKIIKFTSDVRARLSVQIEIKLDIKAR